MNVAKELDRIAKAAPDGVLTPAAVVDAARDESHPLHDRFEWDDSKAAEAHRLNQARVLIRSVRVVVTLNERSVQTIQYVRHPDRPKHEQGYASFQQLVENADERQAALAEEFSRAGAAMKRAKGLADAFALAVEVDAVIEQIEELQLKLRRTSEERLGVAA